MSPLLATHVCAVPLLSHLWLFASLFIVQPAVTCNRCKGNQKHWDVIDDIDGRMDVLTGSCRKTLCQRVGKCDTHKRGCVTLLITTHAPLHSRIQEEGRPKGQLPAFLSSPDVNRIWPSLSVVQLMYFLSYLSCSLADRWGTTVDFTTSFLHSSRFSAFRSMIFHSRPVHSLMLSSHHFLCLPLRLPPWTVPCRIVLASPDDHVTCPHHFSLCLFAEVRRSSYGPMADVTLFLRTWFSV